MARVPKNDNYKGLALLTAGVARYKTLTAQWPTVSSVGQNLKSFTGYGYFSKLVQNSRVGRKLQTNKQNQKVPILHIRRKISSFVWFVCLEFLVNTKVHSKTHLLILWLCLQSDSRQISIYAIA